MTREERVSSPLPGLSWSGLTLRWFALVVLPLTLILIIITLGSLRIHQRAMRTLVGERDERAARTAAAALSEQLQHRATTIQGLAFRASDPVPPAEILESSRFLDSDFDFGLALFSPGSENLASTGDSTLWASRPKELEETLNRAYAEPGVEVVFSPPFPHPAQDESIIFVAFAGEEDTPVAVGAFSPRTLAQRTLAGAFGPSTGSAQAPGSQSVAYVVSADREILYQIGEFPVEVVPQDHPGVAEALRGEKGTIYLPVGRSEHVIAYSPISPVGWALVIEEPWEAVASPLLNTTQLAPLALLPVLLLALVALWFGARQVVQPLQDLEIRAADLAWGNYESIRGSVGGIEEIERLQNTLIHMAQKVQRAQEGLRGYISAITAGQEEERRRLARELHDETIQALIALNQRIQLAQLNLDDGTALNQLADIQDLTEKTINNLRRLTRALRPQYLEDLGLVTALEVLARETTQTGETPVTFTSLGKERRLPPEAELALYRITQESLSNSARHARANQVRVELDFRSQEIALTIADDGVGFEAPQSPAEFAPSGHFGLLGIHERVEMIGGRLEIASAPGEGVRLEVTLK